MVDLCLDCQTQLTCTKDQSCWCITLPNILSPTDSEACYCKPCLLQKIRTKASKLIADKEYKFISSLGPTKKAIQGLDYDINKEGNVVFTSWYHLRRGLCCGSGCSKCPYGHENVIY